MSSIWTIKENPDTSSSTYYGTYTAAFTADGLTYTFTSLVIGSNLIAYQNSSVAYQAYSGTWKSDAARTLTFAESPSGNLLKWLQSNATTTTTLDLNLVSMAAGTRIITVKAIASGYRSSEFSNEQSVIKLAAPENLSASGTTLSFDPVSNATSYEIYASNGTVVTDLGEYTPTVTYPEKGDLITMTLGNSTPSAGTQDLYRVLSIEGSIAQVVAMYDQSTSVEFNDSGTNTYSGGDLDTYLNTTFYGSLNDTAKAAIQATSLTQYKYTYNSSVYNATTHASYADYSTKATAATIGNRYVYALDVEDIEKYFSNTFSTTDIWTLFWNTTSQPSNYTYPWLRSARADYSNFAWFVIGYGGYVRIDGVSSSSAARPALTIDLSKITWSKSE